MWIIWALLSALTAASRRPLEKKLISAMPPFSYSFLVQLVSLPVITTAMLVTNKWINPLTLGLQFWLPLMLATLGFYPLNALLSKIIMSQGELSKVLPLQSLWPVCALLLAWVTLGETPTTSAAVGIVIIVTGIYALGLKGRRLHHPLQPFRQDASSRAMLCGVFLMTFVGILDKAAIHASNPLFYSFASTVSALVVLWVAAKLSRQPIVAYFKPALQRFAAIGTLQGATYVTYTLAIASGPLAYVAALRSSNILMGSVLGILLFKEPLTRAKVLSYSLIVVGSVFLTLGS